MKHTRIVPSGAPHGALAAILTTFPRSDIEALLDGLVAGLDALDGDPDIEPNGDELDGSLAEDDFCSHNVPARLAGPGCPIGDPDTAADDVGCDEYFQDLEEDEQLVPLYGIDQSRGPEPLRYGQDRALMRPHVERIRRHSCRRLTRFDAQGRTHELII